MGHLKSGELGLKLAPAVAVFLLMASACLAQDRFELEAARKVFAARCSPCHPLERTLKKIKDRGGWRKTVDRMRTYAPGQISAEDVQTIVDYLSRVRGTKP